MNDKISREKFLSWAIAPRKRMGLRGYMSIPIGKFTRWLYLQSPVAAELFCKAFYFGSLKKAYMRLFWSLRSLEDQDIPNFRLKAANSGALDLEALKAYVFAVYSEGNLRNLPEQLEKLKNIERFDRLFAQTMSNLQLLDHGFPMPEVHTKPTYEPDKNLSLYLLHHSLPTHSNGYAARSHSVLTGINRHGRNIQAVTRLGYPHDRGVKFRNKTFASKNVIDGVPYHRHLSTEQGLDKLPMLGYLEANIKANRITVERLKPAIIHAASNYINGITAAALGRYYGVISIYEVRGLWEVTRESREPQFAQTDTYALNVKLETQACLDVDHVVTITNALKTELIERGIPPRKISVIPNGVAFERFRPRPADETLRAELGFTSDDIVVGFIGSVVDYEGLSYLIEAAAILRKRGVSTLKVMIVGDGAELEALKLQVKKLKLTNQVVFTGRVSHDAVNTYYSLVDIAPFPRKGLKVCEMVAPLKPFEAMAMEKAVVISDVAAMCEFIEHNVTGLIFKKDNTQSLADVLQTLCYDHELRRRLGLAGRAFVEQDHNWEKLSLKFNDLYQKLIEKHYV